VLACLLLAGIVYSVSFGTVHRHGNGLQKPEAIFTGFAGNAGTTLSIPLNRRTRSDECLICVLHQQLFSSTIDEPHFIVRPLPQIASVSTAAVFYHSTPVVSSPIARLSGRAPPRILG
jgi:hypothetical protein